jgi:hypothetical protein
MSIFSLTRKANTQSLFINSYCFNPNVIQRAPRLLGGSEESFNS